MKLPLLFLPVYIYVLTNREIFAVPITPNFGMVPKRFPGQQQSPVLLRQHSPSLSLLLEIPLSTVQYKKPLDVRTGGRFFLETPMERYVYTSAGSSNLRHVKVIYLMQSMYRPNLMCFFLHFWSMKHSSVPWTLPN